MKGRQRCDDIKSQLDTVSDQIKQAEHAQHEQQRDSSRAAAKAVRPFSATTEPAQADEHSRSKRSSRSVSPAPITDPKDHESEDRSHDKQEKKRKRHDHRSLEVSRPSDAVLAEDEQAKKRQRAPDSRGANKKQTRELSVETLPGHRQRKGTEKMTADASEQGASPAAAFEEEEDKYRLPEKDQGIRDENGGQAADGARELPQLKKKRHLLYKELQEARQQVLLLFSLSAMISFILTQKLMALIVPFVGAFRLFSGVGWG